jgi:hypothetical protein
VPESVAAFDALVYETKLCGFTNAILLAAQGFDAIVAKEFI